ncbi:MAG: hypothetical protein ACQR33_02875 [Candidatus Saccharibacteria bacterium]
MLVDLAFAFVLLVLGLAAVAQYGKTAGKRLTLKQTKADFERAKLNAQLEQGHQNELDAEITRGERQLALERDRLTLKADAELDIAAKLLKAAEKRLAVAEADAKAQVAKLTIDAQAAADRRVIEAHANALEAASAEWAKSQPAPQRIKDPIESVDLNALYKDYLNTAYRQSVRALPLGQWLGENYAKTVNAASKRRK